MNYATGFHDYRENAIRILTETGFFKGVIYEELPEMGHVARGVSGRLAFMLFAHARYDTGKEYSGREKIQ